VWFAENLSSPLPGLSKKPHDITRMYLVRNKVTQSFTQKTTSYINLILQKQRQTTSASSAGAEQELQQNLEREHWGPSKVHVPFMKMFGRVFFPLVGIPYYYSQYLKIQQAKKGLGQPRITADRARQSQVEGYATLLLKATFTLVVYFKIFF